MKKSLTLLILFFLSLNSFAQESKLTKNADKLYEGKDYYNALNLYLQALEKNKTDPYLNFRIAKCYLLSAAKIKSLQYAADAVNNTPTPSPDMLFTLAQAYHINHEFDKAIEYYKKSDPGNKNKKLITKYINECNNGKKYISNPVNVKITNAGEMINTEHQEYLPNITADLSELIYTSRRPGSTGGKKDFDGKYFEDVYISKNKGGAWEKSYNPGGPVNSEIHDACIGLSPDGQTMFLYKSSNGGDIYTSTLEGEKWSKPVSMPFNTEFFETTASLSPDGRTLYFVRKVMDASRDIYSCSKTVDGAWSKAKRESISTEFDDDAPFIHPDGKTLYFSSKGHSTMGGYDIFRTTKTSAGAWATPENLGYPINTAGDDIYFSLSANGKLGFYSSEKEGGFGQQDIYSIRMPHSETVPELTLLKGIISDEETGKPLEALITITDNKSREIVARFNSNSSTGEYLLSLPSGKNYGITVEKPGHLFYSENIFINNEEGYKEQNKEIKLPVLKSGSKIILKNIFFESGKYALQPESNSEMLNVVKFLKNNPSVKIEISGHTDNVGSSADNLTLSQKRAEEVGNFIMLNGIDRSRLLLKGYGSEKPLGVNDSGPGRKSNRRTEFKIL